MALFNILEAPDGNPDRVMVIREGFSPGAFIFTVFWALWQRMWVVAAILIAVLAAISLAAGLLGLGPNLTSVLEAAVSLIFGFEATRLRTVSSERAGYRLVGLIEASNQEAAELQYFTGRQRPSPPVNAPVLPPASHDTLGLFGNL
jgi:hypothetical protein